MSTDIKPNRYNGKGSFSAWKLKVLAFLQSFGLKEVVVSGVRGTTAEITATSSTVSLSDPKTSDDDKVKAEKAYSILLNLLEDSVIDLIAHVEAGNAAGVWQVLLETYEMKSTASLCHTLDTLMNIKFNDTVENFDAYRARFNNLIIKLKEMGETLSPSIQRYIILKGLPVRYESLVQSLKINDSISLEETSIHIKDYYESEKRRRTKVNMDQSDAATVTVDDATENHVAMYARGTSNKRHRNSKTLTSKKEEVCYTCGNPGHKSRNCAMNSKSKEDEYSNFFA
jgi:hypothetical protein